MDERTEDSAPYLPPHWCGVCKKRLYWCGVREQWVDQNHRSSHTSKEGNRRPHYPQTEEPK